MSSHRAPRVLLAGLFHETHTFAAGRTTLRDCTVAQGQAMLGYQGDASPLGGALELARELGWKIEPALDVRAMPGPLASDEIVAFWWRECEAALRLALSTGLDGVFLVLHGAMTSESLFDVEGEMLRRIRGLVGDEVLIGGVTDLHANFSALMANCSDALVTYQQNPHTDARDSAQRAVRLLDGLLRQGLRARTFWRCVPVVWPPTGTGTADEPMRSLERLARECEAADPQPLAVNVHAGYGFADTPDTGVSFSVVSTGPEENAQRVLNALAELTWRRHAEGNRIEAPFSQVWPELQRLLREGGRGPVVIAEPSENIGGGARGSGTGLLREFLAHGLGSSALTLTDAEAVAQLRGVEVGQQVQLRLSGNGFPGAEEMELPVRLEFRSDGRFELEDPHSHLASMFGSHAAMGECATVGHQLPAGGRITLLLSSRPMPPFDLGQLRSQRIEPESLTVIGVKAAVAHRRAYDPIARAHLSVATPGPCASDLRLLPFRHLRRPVFPLDEMPD